MTASVRPTTVADVERLQEPYGQVDDMHLQLASHTFRRPEKPLRTRKWIADLINDPGSLLLVAGSGGPVVGLVGVAVWDTPPMPYLPSRRFVAISNIVVREGFRRRGIGQG